MNDKQAESFRFWIDLILPTFIGLLSWSGSAQYTNWKVNSATSVALHPVAARIEHFKDDSGKDHSGNGACKVDRQRLNDYLVKSESGIDPTLLAYLQALKMANNGTVAKAAVDEVVKKGGIEENLEAMKILDCTASTPAATTDSNLADLIHRVGFEVAVVLAQDQEYLMSRYCKLFLSEPSRNDEVSLKVKAVVAPIEEHKNTILLKDSTSSVHFVIDEKSALQGQQSTDTRKQFGAVSKILANREDDTITARVECRVFFHDEAKPVGARIHTSIQKIYTDNQ